MRIEIILVTTVLAVLLIHRSSWAVAPNADELATARQWTQTTLLKTGPTPAPTPGIEVEYNHDAVMKNAFQGRPLQLGEQVFARGLFCHAPSRIIIRLPGPGAAFHAVAGLDNNPLTSGGRGSIVLSVQVHGQERFRSEVMHGGDLGVPFDVPLDAAAEFVLEVSDSGDGIGCDQADWAEARIELADGSTIWLDELPLAGGPAILEPDRYPFSFTYDGQPFADLLPSWKVEAQSETLDQNRIAHRMTFRDPVTALVVRCDAVEYTDFPTVEWTLSFKNENDMDTPIIEAIRCVDLHMERGDLGEYTLHHPRGSICSASDYEPLETPLAANTTERLTSSGGRGTNGLMPYFNIESTCGDGLILVVGWPGQWAAEFVRDDAKGLQIAAGQELTHFKLLPGEEVRTPLTVLQFWKGDRLRAQNIWRRWMMAHSMPRPGGALPTPQVLASSSRAYEEMIKADTASQIMFIDRYIEEGIRLDYWWMDAGWYVQEKGWPQVGTWEVDTRRFPEGLRPISDHAHAKGLKILVWFEPERVAADTWLTQNHPEWILGGAGGGLLNLGNPEAWAWLVEHIDGLLTTQGIDLYRQDFNMDPLDLWRGNDAEDRQGITEIKHITGYLAYWDELRRRHPDMLIDSCASGGRRNDLETMRRAVPLWRSDYAFEPIGHQDMTYGLSFWIPFHGTGTVASAHAGYYGGGWSPVEPYAFWSNACPSVSCGFDLRVKDIDYATLRALFEQWRSISPCYYGDFYPLTSYSLAKDAWMAWQFHRTQDDQGVVQAFRREESVYVAAAFPLHGLDPDREYSVTNIESGESATHTGQELMREGFEIAIREKPGARVFAYRAAQ
ncbi:MAG TPA: alpha-galactosidase [Candidatus Hydrogenedentes bacterium]|nr:alpha-galactosidase [Candidatus Hydrogenedentota bacterium]HPG68149.1 alpha-galactosidase [Candidatus Hydrogenedentota bacterium]